MDKRESALRKIRRVAVASFENAVRLHEDTILLFKKDRIPSALQMSALSIEEIGKYFMHEDVWWHNRTGSAWSIQDIQQFLRCVYSHTSKQRWFARQVDSPFESKPLLAILQTGELENINKRQRMSVCLAKAKTSISISVSPLLSKPQDVVRKISSRW